MGRHSCRPTSSKHPYRPFAAAEAAADRHRVASTAARLLRGYYEVTTRATATRLLQATTRLLAIRLLPGTTRPLPGYYQATTRLLPGAARAPLGQQHRSSSPARLPAPLTPATRSRRRRSAHQWKDLEEAVLHMPNKLDNSEDQARHSPRAAGCSWCAAQLALRPRRRRRARQASWPGPSGT